MRGLDIGLKALLANQQAINTTGHNISNASTQGYSRQSVSFKQSQPYPIYPIGYEGQGVDVAEIKRNLDTVLERRIQNTNQSVGKVKTEQEGMQAIEDLLSQEEGINTGFTNFVNDLNQLTVTPNDLSARQTFIQSSINLASTFNNYGSELRQQKKDTGDTIENKVTEVNRLASSIAGYNQEIMSSPLPASSDIEDQRDQKIKELSELMNIQVFQEERGSIQISVGGRLLVDGKNATEIKTKDVSSEEKTLIWSDTGKEVTINNGAIKGLLNLQNEIIPSYQERLDTLANSVARITNRIHVTGVPMYGGYTEQTSEESVSDSSAPLSDLGISPGTISIVVRDKATGNETQSSITLDPNTESLDDMVAKLGGVSGITASLTPENNLKIEADAGYDYYWSKDETDALAVLGVGSLFKGNGAENITVTQRIQNDPTELALGKDFTPGDNRNAKLMLEAVQDTEHSELGGMTINEHWNTTQSNIGAQLRTKEQQVTMQENILSGLENRRESISGVNLDEELLNLNRFQTTYQASARLVQTINEMMDSLLSIGV